MSRPGLDPELQAFVEGRRIGRRALAALHRRALARAAEIAAGGGELPAARSTARRRPARLAFACCLAVVAGGMGALAAIHRWKAPVATVPGPGVAQMNATKPARVDRQPAETPPPLDQTIAPPPAAAPSERQGHRRPPDPAAAELSLLTLAHAAYERRNFDAALKLVDEHARRFPRGHLAEQREALRVKSLLGSGRTAEAHRAAIAFAARFPRSVLLTPLLEGPSAP